MTWHTPWGLAEHCSLGMLLTSILALKTAPMSLVIVLRNTSPLGTLLIERFYPEPLRISSLMLASILVMIVGGVTRSKNKQVEMII